MNETGRWLAAWICLAAASAAAEPPPSADPPPTAPSAPAVPPVAPPPRTVVTLGFDDGRSTQPAVLPLLAELGLRASFFVNSGNVGTTGYLDWPALAAIRDAGHELGGHTVDHEDLTRLSREEVIHQVCDDRAALVAAGLGSPISFAYPGGAADAEVAAILADCGYRYGWSQGGLDKAGCTEACLFAEPAEPPDPLRLRSPLSIAADWTLEDLQGYVLRAETSGGWLGLSFHHICDDCAYRYRISPELLREFLVWLAARADRGTVVLPLGEAFAPVSPDLPESPEAPPALPDRPAARPDDHPAPILSDHPEAGASTGCSTAPAAAGTGWLPFAAVLAVLAGHARRPRPAARARTTPRRTGG